MAKLRLSFTGHQWDEIISSFRVFESMKNVLYAGPVRRNHLYASRTQTGSPDQLETSQLCRLGFYLAASERALRASRSCEGLGGRP
jgi:hypothetical protein